MSLSFQGNWPTELSPRLKFNFDILCSYSNALKLICSQLTHKLGQNLHTHRERENFHVK